MRCATRSVIIAPMAEEYRDYSIIDREEISPSTVILRLLPRAGERSSFIPGQFVNVLLPGYGSDAKSYSILSTPADRGLSLSVRMAGPFSRTLGGCRPGEELQVSEPYGYFYPPDNTTPRVCIAGGIGIVPFASFIRTSIEEKYSPPTLLLHSSRTVIEAVFRDLFVTLAAQDESFAAHYFITRERKTLPDAHETRITPAHLSETLSRFPLCNFFLCGSIEFVRDMRLSLKSLDVPEERIFTESFY